MSEADWGWDPDEDLEFEFKNAGQYNTERRLSTIHNAHDRFQAVRQQAYDPKVRRVLSQSEIDDYVFQTAKAFVFELTNYLSEDFVTEGRGGDIWDKREVGPIVFDPPEDALQLRQTMQQRYGDATIFGMQNVPVQGLRDFIGLTPPYSVTWSVEADVGISTKTQTVTSQHSIPISVSDKAFLYANQFLSGLGIDANIVAKALENRKYDPF
jgi:hypothetical protein